MAEEWDRRVSVAYDLAREAGLEAGEHPSPEQLFEYQEGRFEGKEEAEVQDHLALCADCTRMVLELSGAVEPDFPEVRASLSEERMDALWPGMRDRLPLPPQRQAAPWYRSLERVALPLAASILLATLASSFWLWSLRRENRLLAEPQVNVAVRNLVPQSEEGVRSDEARPTGLPQGVKAVLLILNLVDLRPFPAYRAEIVEAPDGKILWASNELQRDSGGNFTLQLPLPFSGSGRVHIRLFGLDGQRRNLLAQYEVDLRETK